MGCGGSGPSTRCTPKHAAGGRSARAWGTARASSTRLPTCSRTGPTGHGARSWESGRAFRRRARRSSRRPPSGAGSRWRRCTLAPPFDVITTGRVGVDLYPQQIGVPLAEVQTFAKFLGGTATNVAVQAARLGSRSAVVTKVGDDGFGPFVRDALQRFGVDPRWVGTDPELRTPIVFCEVHPPDHFPLLFYREPKAPDLNLFPADFDRDAVN